jgi:hypothetical protein
LGQGFSPGNASTGGNKVADGSINQGINGFSPFSRSPSADVSGLQGTIFGRNAQQQPQNTRSPFGGSPGGATAGFSPFGGSSNMGTTNLAPVMGARFGSNGSPPSRPQYNRSGGINGAGITGATINGAGVNGGRYGRVASGMNGASGVGLNDNPSNPLNRPDGNNFDQRQAQEQARRLEEARREGIEEARREAQRRNQSMSGRFGAQAELNNGSGQKLDKALLNAIKSSDEAYKPPQVILDAPSISPLLEQVDGPNLYQYDETEKVYSGRAVKVMGESSLDIPIRISAPGSIVEYTVEKKSYDFNLGITAKLDQGGAAVVKVSPASRSTDIKVSALI